MARQRGRTNVDFHRATTPLVAAVVVTCMVMAACSEPQRRTDSPAASRQAPPAWAYPIQPPVTPAPDDGVQKRVPESTVALTLTQIRDLYVPPDWHPGDHPPMPEVVARGRKPELFACGYCHYPNGQGRPENSSLAGLSAGYIARQLYDYQSGARAGLLSPRMKEIVDKLTVEDMVSIAAYTASRTP